MFNPNHSMKEKSVIFVGFMGVGKTTVAKIVAQKLYRDFIDIDVEIEKAFGMSITQIFATYGERTFREKEKELVLEYCQQPLKVISLGGGAFLQEQIKDACLENGLVFHLDISWENWQERMHLLIDSRPILQTSSLEDIKELFHQRRTVYEKDTSKFITDNFNAEEAADYLVDSIKLAWELYD